MSKSVISFDFAKSFRPKRYLHEYYQHIGPENTQLLQFFSRAYAQIFTGLKTAEVLELGGGPTIYQLISLSKYNVEIDFAEFAPQNLEEINRWITKHKNKFSWKKYFLRVHELEKNNFLIPKFKSAKHHEDELRKKIRKLISCDIRDEFPLGTQNHRLYDIVSSHFVSESVTPSFPEWEKHLTRVTQFVRPHGYLVLSSIIQASRYKVGGRHFPAAPISQTDIYSVLKKLNFQLLDEDFVPAEQQAQGYTGLHMLLAQKVASSI